MSSIKFAYNLILLQISPLGEAYLSMPAHSNWDGGKIWPCRLAGDSES